MHRIEASASEYIRRSTCRHCLLYSTDVHRCLGCAQLKMQAAMLKIAQCSQLDLDMPSLLGGRWPYVALGDTALVYRSLHLDSASPHGQTSRSQCRGSSCRSCCCSAWLTLSLSFARTGNGCKVIQAGGPGCFSTRHSD